MTSEAQRIVWDVTQIPDLQDRHYVVTGGNSGLGLEITRQLAKRGATVTMACRSVAKGEAAVQVLEGEIGPVEVVVRELDLASLTSIRDFAAALSAAPIDGLVNNAGVMAIDRALTADGFETQLGVNHLGHFALTAQLFSGLRKAASATVLTMSSNAHKPGTIRFDDLMGENRYSRFGAYAQSKLANLLFAFELQRRAGSSTFKSVAAHPGYSATNLSSPLTGKFGPLASLVRSVESSIAQSAAQGALPALYALTAREVPGGAYAGPDGWQEWRGNPKLTTAIPLARDPLTAARLWEISCELTGVDPDFPTK